MSPDCTHASEFFPGGAKGRMWRGLFGDGVGLCAWDVIRRELERGAVT